MMHVTKEVLEALEVFASRTYSTDDNVGCGEASGCNGASGECACHGDGYVW